MKFEDLTVVPIKTIMATQRILLMKFGYAISFMGDEQSFTFGDGVSTFEVRVYKHNLDLDKDTDYFGSNINPEAIDFDKCLFMMGYVLRSEIDNFFESFVA